MPLFNRPSLDDIFELLLSRKIIAGEFNKASRRINKLKNNRHKLLHNKKINTKITNRELNELYHIFAKLIVYKINALISGGNND